MVTYDDTMLYLPLVMRRLRLRAGYKTQTSALREIRRKTGVRITAARICEWESGRTAPSLRSLFAFLLGLGYDLKALQDEVEHLVGSGTPPPAKPPKDSREQQAARRRAEIEERERMLETFEQRHGPKASRSRAGLSGRERLEPVSLTEKLWRM